MLDFYNTVFCPQNLVISINGNVDDKAVIDSITDIFGANKADNKNVQRFEYNKYKNLFKHPQKQQTVKKTKTLKQPG